MNRNITLGVHGFGAGGNRQVISGAQAGKNLGSAGKVIIHSEVDGGNNDFALLHSGADFHGTADYNITVFIIGATLPLVAENSAAVGQRFAIVIVAKHPCPQGFALVAMNRNVDRNGIAVYNGSCAIIIGAVYLGNGIIYIEILCVHGKRNDGNEHYER